MSLVQLADLTPLPVIDWKPTGYTGPGCLRYEKARFTVTACDGREVMPMPVIGDERQASQWRFVWALLAMGRVLGAAL